MVEFGYSNACTFIISMDSDCSWKNKYMNLTSSNQKLYLENSGRMNINHNPLQLYTPHNNFLL